MDSGGEEVKVCVAGLWHLGTVTAACLASAGHCVVGFDGDTRVVKRLQAGGLSVFEPGLEDLVRQELQSHRLTFTSDATMAAQGADIVWITYDTPVDEDDRADVEWVMDQVVGLFPHINAGALVLISSQLPVLSTRKLEQLYASAHPGKPVSFAYSPENLRLGKAIQAFMQAERVAVGTRSEGDRAKISELLRGFTERIEWMSVESAEMSKHALNAFLATSVAFINEVASLCEQVHADAKEVERSLKSDARIGPRAYLAPGAAFSGGTLARDVRFLAQIGAQYGVPTYLIAGVHSSNDAHKSWTQEALCKLLGDVAGKCVAIWGLAYKVGTDTLRRSSSVELCRWLLEQRARVKAHDPAVTSWRPELPVGVEVCPSLGETLQESEALVVATEWPEYQAVGAETVLRGMRKAVVVDPNRFVAKTLGNHPRIQYAAVGQG